MDGTIFNASSFIVTQWLFLKLLAITYLCAFSSLLVQVKGLYGSQGIIPIHELLEKVKKRGNKHLFFHIPTLFWWRATDQTLQLVAAAGVLFSFLALLGIGPVTLFFFALWFCYLSFVSVGSVFLSFQWDVLLLEVGFMAIFFSAHSPPSIFFIILLWFVLFRFMFSSGLVKVFASTPEWRTLEAMRYHFETQPLPTKLAYYIHRLPKTLAKALVVFTFFFELLLPFLIFSPSDIRLIVFILFVFFQITIFLTGNYAFFNLLSIVLCIPLLEDHYWYWLVDGFSTHASLDVSFSIVQIFLSLVAILILFLNIIQLVSLFTPIQLFYQILDWINPYYIVNSYGLFANMTTKRPEIIIEGSEDGVNWKSYEFKWKPDDLFKSPKQIAPHQPRLDWQMWFAALSRYQYHPWFFNFLVRLLEGSEPVLGLLKTNPFPHAPPKFIRALLYDYRFSDFKTKQQTGQWWTRTLKGTYMPTISIQVKSTDYHR